MNVGTIITLMLALALAAIGSSTRYQAEVSNSSLAVRGNNLNHNETLVRDTTLIQTDGWSLWLNSEQSFTDVPLLGYFLSYRSGVTCSPWVCGSNHNETLVNDEATTEQEDDWSLWLNSEQSFTDVSLLAYFLSYRSGVTCSPWICGSNHNETLVNDEATTQQADHWSRWLTRKQSFVAAPFLRNSCPSGLALMPTVVLQPQQYVRAVGRPSAVAADE